MLKNYFKTAWRNLIRNKIFSLIKILGLSIGLTVCMLIILYTRDELSYDQFHTNKAQIFRVVQDMRIADDPERVIGTTTSVVGGVFAKEIPEIKQFVRVDGQKVTVKKNTDVFTETAHFVDDNFFGVFTFPLLEGDQQTALKDPHSVVLSEKMAIKYFGTTDVIGKTMQIEIDNVFENFMVKAVARNSAQNSTLNTDMLLPFTSNETQAKRTGWIGGSLNTFLLLSPAADIRTTERKMQDIFNRNTSEQVAKAKKDQGVTIDIKLGLQALTDIHLSTAAGPDPGMAEGSSPVYSYILISIAIFILLIACINFINLAIAQSLKRGKEIGIRKIVGGTRKQLIQQFLAESFLVSLAAFITSILLTITILPFFSELANKKLSIAYLSGWYMYSLFLLLLLVTSFISGFYPSLVLSAFKPLRILYNKQQGTGKNYLPKALIIFQFALSIFLVIATIAVNEQLNYLVHTDLGYDTRNLVRIELPPGRRSDQLAVLFQNDLNNQPGILGIAARNNGRTISGVKANGRDIEIEYNKIDANFLPVFKIPLMKGRNFSPGYPADSFQAVMVNECFIKEAGWKLNEAIGKPVSGMEGDGHPVTIIGVVKDYHFASLKEKITPEVFTLDTTYNAGEIWVKIRPDNIPQTLSVLHDTYRKLVSYFPYSYQFMDDITQKNYEKEARWKQIISIASMLFIFISCMGLLGLMMLSIEHRTKEIGIRKVLGAAVSAIVRLIAKEYIILVSLAFFIAVPFGYYFVNKWLQNFAYRINIGWWIFALAGLSIITIVVITMSFQVIKAALANPVKSLKSE